MKSHSSRSPSEPLSVTAMFTEHAHIFQTFQLIVNEVVIPGAALKVLVKACSNIDLSGEIN